MEYTEGNNVHTSDNAECNTEIKHEMEELNNLRSLIDRQYCADLKTIKILQALTQFEDDSISRLIACYIYGVINGKRLERERRKGGNAENNEQVF